MTNEVKGRRAENSSGVHDVSAPREGDEEMPQSQGVRQIFKLLILFFVSYRLFSLAPYNQLPDFEAIIRDTNTAPSPATYDTPVSTTPSNHKGKEERRTTTASVPSTKPHTTSSNKPKVDHQRVNQIMMEAESLQKSGNPNSNNNKIVSLYEQVLQLDPRHTYANLQLGFVLITAMDNPDAQRKGFELLEKTLDENEVDNPFSHDTPQAFVLSQTIGRYRWEQKEYKLSQKYLAIAKKAAPTDTCTEVLIASMIDPYPHSVEAQNESMELYLQRMDAIVQKGNRLAPLNPQLIQMVPGATDTYVHCLCTLFHHSFYYHTDIALATNLHYQVAKAVWPELHYISPKFLSADGKTFKKPKPKMVKRKIRLGIASGHFTEGSSVVEDFKGVIKNLSRDIFDIHHIYIMEKPVPPSAIMMDKRDSLTVVKKEMDDTQGINKWIEKPRKDIEALNLDILLYLDLTMSMMAHRLGMSRLAPVQAVSHGHPITSGFPRSIMDYYISWAAAELPFEEAQSYYTEELKLIPSDSLHQYYEERTKDGRSLMDNQDYSLLVKKGRSSFSTVPPDGNWYLIMQKPFKLMPEFDDFVAGVLRKDPHGRVIMHEEASSDNRLIFIERLYRAGCDMERVHFMPVLPHHKLMALYILSDVILDSYPAGGCTTTREVFEAGKVLVTLPSTLLGSRWTLAYLNILGDERLKELFIAKNMDEYTSLAANLGKNITLRSEAERRIQKSMHKLYRSHRAVEEWTKILLEISPVQDTSHVDEL